MRISALVAAGVLAFAALPGAAQTMKPGVWEVKSKFTDPETAKAMEQFEKQMAAMTPAQRKEMEKSMASQGMQMVPGSGTAMRMCVTKEMIDRNEVFQQQGCRMTKDERKGNTYSIAYTCPSQHTSGEMQVTVNSPESYNSRVAMRVTAGGQAKNMTMESSGKWIKAECGDLKPPVPAAKK